MALVLDIATFRAAFPAFADSSRYPNAQITLFGTVAELMTNKDRWGDMWTFGVSLYVAHELTLEAQSTAAAQNGGVPGGQSGATASKAVGSVSVSYDTTSSAEKNAGWWNLTTYGKQYFRLLRMFGAGAVQL